MDSQVTPAPRGADPFDTAGVTRGPDGVSRYDDRPASLVHMLRASVERDPGGEALVEVAQGDQPGGRLTYQQLWDRAARVAGGLREQGVQPGDRVASLLPAGLDWVVGFFGTQLAGAVAVPVNTRFAEPEVAYVVDDSGAGVTLRSDVPLPDGSPHAADTAAPDDLAAIFYTSGTTGFPKGAMTTHANFLSNSETAMRCCGMPRDLGTDLRTLISVPLFHVTGCNSQLLPLLEHGGTAVVLPTLDIARFLSVIPEERVNVLTTVPAVYFYALHQPTFGSTDVSSVRWLSYGGAPIAPSLVQAVMAGFPAARVGNGFGLTETSSIATYLPHEWAAEHADSVGFAAPVVDLAVDAPDPATGVGELLVRGSNVVAGYWNKPAETAAAFVDGWLRTGDLARVSDGLTYVVDRAKDMINRGGENVYCVEVENALAGAPGVLEGAVLGVPDEMMGEKVGAVVVPAPGAAVDVGALMAYLADRLADFKLPQWLAVRTEPLPRNPGGKVQKARLREESTWEAVPRRR